MSGNHDRRIQIVRDGLGQSITLRETVLRDEAFLSLVVGMAADICAALRAGGCVFSAGNGGSFADAQQLAAEFVGRFKLERQPMAAVCVGANSSTLTAVSNDSGYRLALARELSALGSSADVLIALSTSGNSENLVEAVNFAQSAGLKAWSLLGCGGDELGSASRSVIVPSDDTARIQELHITIGHLVCQLVESELHAPKESQDESECPSS